MSLARDGSRRKRLKCDGTSPACGRCPVDAIACSYTGFIAAGSGPIADTITPQAPPTGAPRPSPYSAYSSLVAEGIRRTDWEPHAIDIYFAAIHHLLAYHTAAVQPSPFLPCTQAIHEAGRCDPNPPTLRAFEDRIFSSQPQASFSTLCFRVDAICFVSRVLTTVSHNDNSSSSIQALDSALAGWFYNLTFRFSVIIDPSGDVDSMLFKACCFISCAIIFIYSSRSDLLDRVLPATDIAYINSYIKLAPTASN